MATPIILCIDDEELGLEIRKMVLEGEGYTVLTARDAAAGLSLFETRRIDAVILDYTMPGIDGGKLAAIMREKNPAVPILMLSAHVELPDSVLQLVDACATKGGGALVLTTRLRELLERSSARKLR